MNTQNTPASETANTARYRVLAPDWWWQSPAPYTPHLWGVIDTLADGPNYHYWIVAQVYGEGQARDIAGRLNALWSEHPDNSDYSGYAGEIDTAGIIEMERSRSGSASDARQANH